jgi:predicted ATPase/class 3 adenylate cyclase
VSFLFSDVEGSTQLIHRLGERYSEALADQRKILQEAIEGEGGLVVETEGDATFAVFSLPPKAVAAAFAAQRNLATHDWPEGESVRVRIGLHTGEGKILGRGYVGLDVHRAARISAAAHGGQVLMSASTKGLVERALPEGARFLDLGEHRLKDLDDPEHLFQLFIPDLQADFPPPRTVEARAHHFPAEMTSFVGREREVAEVKALIGRNRLLTLTGSGGCGKTRLALKVASDLLTEFPDGVFFVSLSPLRDTALVVPTIAQTVGARERPDEPVKETLRQYLAPKELLLLLDNFEHLVDGAPIVTELLAAAPGVKALVTSREVLRLSGEREFAVPPLGLPELDHAPSIDFLSRYDAVALFIERAKAVDPRFPVTEEAAPTLVEICVRLDGLPLAIELAAARARVFGPEALLARLEHSLALLRGGPRDLPARQQTLRATIGWSYDLLNDLERTLFRRLGLFVRGSTLEAAREVAASDGELGIDLLEGLVSLVDKSLLLRELSDRGEPRFRMLETVREFARATLAEENELAEVARRHAEFFLRFAEEAEPQVLGSERVMWLDRVEQDHDNIRAALRWSVDSGNADIGMRIGGALWRFWLQRNHLREGRRWLEEILALPGAKGSGHRMKAATALGGLAYWQSDYDAAGAAYRETLEISRAVGDVAGQASAQYNLGYIVTIAGDLNHAWELFSSARDIHRRLGDQAAYAYDGMALGLVAQIRQEWSTAKEVLAESIRLFRDLGDRWGLAQLLTAAGRAYREEEGFDRAEEIYREALAIFREAGDLSGVSMVLGATGALRVLHGQTETGLRIAAAGHALEENIGGRAPVALRAWEDARELAAGVLEPTAIARAWSEGEALSLDAALSMMLEEGTVDAVAGPSSAPSSEREGQ